MEEKLTARKIQPEWKVLLLGGSSSVGKTTVARQIGLHLGISWLQVDDFRLAFQRSRVTLPEQTEALYFFEETADVWALPPEDLRDRFVAVGQVLEPALEIVIGNHVDTNAPIVIEGDGILPSLCLRPPVQARADNGQVKAVFLIEPDEDAMFHNMLERNRGIASQTEAELRKEARAKWLYGQWLADEARRYGLPVLVARPWSMLLERILEASSESIN